MADDTDALIAQVRDWNGDDVYDVQPILEALVTLDEKDTRKWMAPVRGILREINGSLWPDDLSPDFEWWALDYGLMRLYTEPGKFVFKTARLPQRRVGGTP